ncbi:GGDEF domain-containing protein [Thalassomonas haliotis]|nr:GGDEF domain-containing protein [Thalassomonas haliotis]
MDMNKKPDTNALNEQDFLLNYNNSQQDAKRSAIILTLVVIFIFMIWDLLFLGWQHPATANILWSRAVLTLPPLAWLYYCCYSDEFIKKFDFWCFITAFFIGISILYNIYQYSQIGHHLRVDGLLLYTFVLYIIPGFFQKHKTWCGTLISLGYLLLAYSLQWPDEKLVYGAVYLGIFNLAGSWHSWNNDRKTKNDYFSHSLLKKLALTDQLTGLYNRHGFDEKLNQLMAKADDSGGLLALIILDIDYFKRYNDSLGHLVGDQCLMAVSADLLAQRRNENDLVVRFGGEEFLMVFYQQDGDLETLNRHIREICPAIAALNIPHPSSDIADIVTASAGASIYRAKSATQRTQLMLAADSALYRAKQAGRNQTRISGDH